MRAFVRARELLDAGEAGPNADLNALCRPRAGLLLHSIASIGTLLILIDMIWNRTPDARDDQT
jgi:hypothetical protein